MSAVRREPTLLNPPRASCHHQHASFSLRVMQHYFPERGRGLLCLFWSASVTLRLDSGRKLPSFFYPEIAASHGDVQTLLLWLVCNRKSYSVTSCYVMTLPTTRCCTALCKQARRKVRRCKGSHLTAVCVCVCVFTCLLQSVGADKSCVLIGGSWCFVDFEHVLLTCSGAWW